MRPEVKEDRGNKHAEIKGLDEMSKKKLKEELEKKEYIRQKQAEIIKDFAKKINVLKETVNKLSTE